VLSLAFDKIEFGNRLYLARKNMGYKQIEVCNILKISQSTYSKIESGYADITLTTLYELTDLLNVSAAYLLGINDNDNFTKRELLEIEKYKKFVISSRN
jgi:transcriptional regulator with XRE-family HTH domain